MAQKTPELAGKHYEESIPLVSSRYSEGIDRVQGWKSAATSQQATKNYADGIQMALAKGLREKGLAKVTDEEWKTAAKNKGAASIGNAMTLAKDKYVRNVAPTMNAAISAINSAPARTTDYKTNVNNRLLKVIEAQKKAAGKL